MFSFKLNPRESSQFAAQLRAACSTKKQVFLDLSRTTRITTEAVAVLLACVKCARQGVNITGNSPEDQASKTFLGDSGFFNHIAVPPDEFRKGPRRGLIRYRTRFKVDSKAAGSLIDHVKGSLEIQNGFLKSSYRALIEAMANTHEHAQHLTDTRRHRQDWWATAALELGKGEAYFACVDLGVGIFNSLPLRSVKRKLMRKAGVLSNASLLHDILHGQIQSRTGVPFRGKGLPAIYDAAKAGRLKKLVIVSNDAYADVEKEEYGEVSPPFDGTILAWEVTREKTK